MTDRHQVELDAPGFGRAGTVIRYGHRGRPVLVFPGERGRAWDHENNGMVGAVADLVDGGRCKLYCVDSFDEQTWSSSSAGSMGDPPHRFAALGPAPRALLADKGIPHEFDVWGHDSAHDWDWWQKQIAHHLPRFV